MQILFLDQFNHHSSLAFKGALRLKKLSFSVKGVNIGLYVFSNG
jgi:hypothetical protein